MPKALRLVLSEGELLWNALITCGLNLFTLTYIIYWLVGKKEQAEECHWNLPEQSTASSCSVLMSRLTQQSMSHIPECSLLWRCSTASYGRPSPWWARRGHRRWSTSHSRVHRGPCWLQKPGAHSITDSFFLPYSHLASHLPAVDLLHPPLLPSLPVLSWWQRDTWDHRLSPVHSVKFHTVVCRCDKNPVLLIKPNRHEFEF